MNEKPFQDSDTSYPITGWRMGNFKYTFHFLHPNGPTMRKFHQAHNDYLELAYNTGIVGIFLFLSCLWVFFRQIFIKVFNNIITEEERALTAGFIVICVAAGGTFVWQIGTTIFYSCVFFSLLNNREVTGHE